MAEATWEKSAAAAEQFRRRRRARGRLHFLLAGLLILVATAWLIISGTATGARYFITVDELVGDPAWLGKTVRVSGAVLGPQHSIRPGYAEHRLHHGRHPGAVR